MKLSRSHWYPGSVAVLDCIDIPDLCPLFYFVGVFFYLIDIFVDTIV